MNEHPPTPFHPRWYRQRVSTWWWLERWSSLRFILRELTSVFVAWFVFFLLVLLAAVGRGEAEYLEFLRWAASPGVLVVNALSVVFVVFHAVTWFNLAPQAMVVHFRGRRVPGVLIAGANFAAWAVISCAVLWILGNGR